MEVHPTVPQEATIAHQNALHGEKTASTATYPVTSLEYAAKKNEPPDSANALIAHVHYNPTKDSYTNSTTNYSEEILADLKLTNTANPPNVSFSFKALPIFSDSGASICLAGPRHLKLLHIHPENLIPSNKLVSAVWGSKLLCHGWVPTTFCINNQQTNQPLFICDKVNRIYFSKKGCIAVNILSSSFPHPVNTDTAKISFITAELTPHKPSSSITTNPNPREQKLYNTSKTNCPKLPVRLSALPYPATENNIPYLQQFLQQQFATSAFNLGPPFPKMKTPPAHIYLKPDATPAFYTPIPIPYHWKEQVKASLDADIAKDIIAKVTTGTPTTWCSHMIVVPKKYGTPRRTVDLQRLNVQCLCETHHCPSPFQLVRFPPTLIKLY